MVIFGRPLRGRDRQHQYKRKPSRYQPSTVFGVTITRTSVRRGQMPRRVVQKSRSREFNVWPRPFPFEDCDMLPEGENFEGGVAATAEEVSFKKEASCRIDDAGLFENVRAYP